MRNSSIPADAGGWPFPPLATLAELSIAELATLHEAHRAASYGYLLVLNMPKCDGKVFDAVDDFMGQCDGRIDAIVNELRGRKPVNENEQRQRLGVLLEHAAQDSMYEVWRVFADAIPSLASAVAA